MLALACLLFSAGVSTCWAQAVACDGKDIVDTAVAAGSFKTLAAALKAAGLVDTLKGEGPFTVFAPTDKAFAKLPAGTLDDLLKPENKDKLTAILTYHVVPGRLAAKDVSAIKSAKTANGQELTIAVNESVVMIDGAKVAKADIMCRNGVIHVIDAVVLPKEPTKIDKDIVDTAVSAGSFKTLVAAVQAAGLVTQLKGAGPYTVFAPTDEAFAKIPKADLDALMKDKAKLSSVLQYHVLTGNVSAADLKMMKDFGTAQGQRIQIASSGTTLKLNNATVVKADVPASNGVIHVIDTVLLPK